MRFKRTLSLAFVVAGLISASACAGLTYIGVYKIERDDFRPPILFPDLVSEVALILRPFGFMRSPPPFPMGGLIVFTYRREDAFAEYKNLSGADSRDVYIALDADSSWITVSDKNKTRETAFMHSVKAALEFGLQKKYGIRDLEFERLNDFLSFN